MESRKWRGNDTRQKLDGARLWVTRNFLVLSRDVPYCSFAHSQLDIEYAQVGLSYDCISIDYPH